MDKMVKGLLVNLGSADDQTRLIALETLLNITENKVEWIYEAWDEMVAKLEHENSYQRTIAILVLCSLAKSDHDKRMADLLPRLLAHTRDEKFVTSRKCLQNIWQVAVADAPMRKVIIAHLEKQFADCPAGKHYNLIRQDILFSMRRMADHAGDDALLERAKKLVEMEQEEKYLKKYEAVLRGR